MLYGQLVEHLDNCALERQYVRLPDCRGGTSRLLPDYRCRRVLRCWHYGLGRFCHHHAQWLLKKSAIRTVPTAPALSWSASRINFCGRKARRTTVSGDFPNKGF